ncbi:hypothetical protein, partial [Butyrivibrio sp. VCB2006]|uniref:hypothetical protein n=1 Tax=Butyrivibrio sp. VCB2006 TaxID=1280679 RepID=UPI00056D9763
AVKINGEAKATQKDVGKKDMGLKGTPKDGDDFTCSFINTDENFDVTFVVIDGYQEITPVSDKVTVKISGNQTIKTYTGDTFTADGYTVDIDDETYTENDFRLKSDAQGVNIHLSSADVCELSMGLTKDSFENTNANFTNVEFVIEQQGLLKITPAAVTVTITGTKEEGIPYDGEDHTVNGFTASANNTLYNVTEGSADFTFNFDGGEADSWNTASATQKEVGTAYMRLADSMFTNNNDNFEVTWDIKDGSVEVVKKILTVKIKGNKDSKEYTGSEQQVEGYTISNESELGDYPTSAISFTGEAVAKGKEVDTYPMNLDISKFTNSNTNYQVTFELAEDGEL